MLQQHKLTSILLLPLIANAAEGVLALVGSTVVAVIEVVIVGDVVGDVFIVVVVVVVVAAAVAVAARIISIRVALECF